MHRVSLHQLVGFLLSSASVGYLGSHQTLGLEIELSAAETVLPTVSRIDASCITNVGRVIVR
jgi:hypothetical protein